MPHVIQDAKDSKETAATQADNEVDDDAPAPQDPFALMVEIRAKGS
jgi:superkiller protein 3